MSTKKQSRILTSMFFLLVLFTLLLSGCGDSRYSSFSEIDYHKGTEALVVSFLNQAPPNTVYEQTEFDVQMYVENKGAFNLADGYRATAYLKYDSAVVMAITEGFLGQGLYANKNRINLYGKSYYFPEGEKNFFALDRFFALPLQGNFETNKVSFYLSLCYPYETFFADEICVDVDPQSISPRKKICEAKDKSYSGGQGAPIAVSKIETQMVPRGVYIQPQFVIHLEHKGKGSFALQNLILDSSGDAGCGAVSIDDVGKVEVEIKLGMDELICKPNDILFKDNKATLYCQLPDQKITGVGANYLTTMTVNIKYIYMQNFQKDITVQRSQGTLFSTDKEPQSDWECYPWEVFVKGAENECVQRCSYCATHSGSQECVVTDMKKDASGVKTFSTDHACTYKSTSDCIEAGDDCILQAGLCQTGTYCGVPACFSGSNYPPSILVSSSSAENQIQFFCIDQDDIQDAKRTCGCKSIAHYFFIHKDDARSCESISLSEYNELPNGFYNSASARTEFSIFISNINPESDLCLRVEDTTRATSYRRISYPWRS
jgi:hypothetical protein